jgi:hypothetical protein
MGYYCSIREVTLVPIYNFLAFPVMEITGVASTRLRGLKNINIKIKKGYIHNKHISFPKKGRKKG